MDITVASDIAYSSSLTASISNFKRVHLDLYPFRYIHINLYINQYIYLNICKYEILGYEI